MFLSQEGDNFRFYRDVCTMQVTLTLRQISLLLCSPNIPLLSIAYMFSSVAEYTLQLVDCDQLDAGRLD